MTFPQVKNILDRAIEFHQLLEDFYSKIEDISQKDSVKLLVNYMARHENVLKHQLSKITEEQSHQLKEVWVKYELEFATCRCLENLKIDKDSSVDDVVDAGLQLNQCLINLYHYMSEKSPTEEVGTLFSQLELMEIAEKKKLSRTRGM